MMEFKGTGERAIGIGALLFLLTVQGLFLSSWVKADRRPAAWDESVHTGAALDYRERLREGDFRNLLAPTYLNYPPLVPMSFAVALGATDDIADTASVVNFLYFAVTIAFIFLIGREFGNPWAGVSAAFVFAAYPVVGWLLRFANLDVGLTAWVCASVYALLRSRDFADRRWSLAFGALAGCAMLAKMTAFAPIAAPAAVCLFHAVKARRFANPALAFALFLVVTFPWYAPNFIPMALQSAGFAKQQPASGLILDGLLSGLWYPLAFPRQMNAFLAVLFIVGFILTARDKAVRPLQLWLIGTIAIFTLISNRNIRYTVPGLPAAALLSVLWLPAGRRWAHGAVCIASLFLMVAFRFLPATIGDFHAGTVPLPVLTLHPPVVGDWRHDDILESVRRNRNAARSFTRVVVLANAPSLHSTTLELSRRAAGMDGFAFKGASKRRWAEFAHMILYKTGNLGPAFTTRRVRELAAIVASQPDWFRETYVEADRWSFPDGSEGILFAAAPRPHKTVDIGVFNLDVDEMTFGRIRAEGVKMRAVASSDADTAVGRLKELTFECDRIDYRGAGFEDVRLRLVSPQLHLPLFLETGQIQFISIERMEPRATVRADALEDYARSKLEWLSDPSVQFDGSMIEVAGSVGGIPLRVAAELRVERDVLTTRLLRLRFAGIPFPRIFLRHLTNRRVLLEPNRDMPFHLAIREIKGEEGRLTIQ